MELGFLGRHTFALRPVDVWVCLYLHSLFKGRHKAKSGCDVNDYLPSAKGNKLHLKW